MAFPLLSTAYFPCIAWFQQALTADTLVLEKHENYGKQTYRNRTKILSAHGLQDLIIPVIHASSKMNITELYSDETQLWKPKHWHALKSAYGKSPFFMHYAWHFEPYFANKNQVNLYQFNAQLMQLIFKLLKTNVTIIETEEFNLPNQAPNDFRDAFYAKGTPSANELLKLETYYQNFSDKYPFTPNLSILDLLFQQGPAAIHYLR